MPSFSIKVGSVELVSVSDGFPTRSPLMPFPDTTIEQWREFPELMKENDQVGSRYGTTVVRSGGKLIIVDTGLQAPDGILMEDMKAKGVQPEEVNLVVFTHLHPDHVGWNLTAG
ncbi:MAG TPA: MBL fold metallo-hydrolase, partial [Dehalococcoidia bacterium]|nr:MBL fold metallo-hydrolase [Dehalococcoidia bacterium]